MKKNLQIFNFNSASIRTITNDTSGDVWFIAKDITDCLGYRNASEAIRDNCKKAKSLKSLNNSCQLLSLEINNLRSDTVLIPESDVYRLVMRSKLESAEIVQDFIVEEVIPSIRKTGGYQSNGIDPMQALNDPATMRNLLLGYSEKVLTLESAVKVLEPKAIALDRLSAGDGSQCITDSAKALKMQPKALFTWLQSINWIYKRVGGKNWLGYQDKIKQGLIEHKLTTVSRSDGSEKVTEQALLTPKGITRLSEILGAI